MSKWTGPNWRVQIDWSKETSPNKRPKYTGPNRQGQNRHVQIDMSK